MDFPNTANAQQKTIRGYDARLLRSMSAQFDGAKSRLLLALADVCKGKPHDGIKLPREYGRAKVAKVVRSFEQKGLSGLFAPLYPTCVPMPSEWDVATLKELLENDLPAAVRQRIETAKLVYEGRSIADVAQHTSQPVLRVRRHLDEFVLFGPSAFQFPEAPQPKLDEKLLLRIAEVEKDQKIRTQARILAQVQSGEDLLDVADGSGMKVRSAARLLRRAEIFGLEAIYATVTSDGSDVEKAKARKKSRPVRGRKKREKPADAPINVTEYQAMANDRDALEADDLSQIVATADVEPVSEAVLTETEIVGSDSGPVALLDRDTLVLKTRRVTDPARVRKLSALSMLAGGATAREAARVHGAKADEVREWLAAYLAKGVRGI